MAVPLIGRTLRQFDVEGYCGLKLLKASTYLDLDFDIT